MSAADPDPRPWWASDPDDEPDAHDPLTAHRAARRGEVTEDGWWEPAAEAVARFAEDLARTADAAPDAASPDADATTGSATDGPGGVDRSDDPDRTAPPRSEDGDDPPPPHTPEVCGICPVCVGLRALGESRPELVGHLAAAARHLAAAVRTMADSTGRATEGGRGERPGGERPDGVQHIDLEG